MICFLGMIMSIPFETSVSTKNVYGNVYRNIFLSLILVSHLDLFSFFFSSLFETVSFFVHRIQFYINHKTNYNTIDLFLHLCYYSNEFIC